jgi:predicted esterase
MTDVVHRLEVSRHARVLVAGDPAKATEAWLILHGYGMLARGMLHWFRGAERSDRVLVVPEALSRFYSEMSGGRRVIGASWTTREEIADEVEDQYAYLERCLREWVTPGVRLQVHGFSQGVSVATRWFTRSDRAVERLVCWAGIIPDDVSAETLKRKLGPDTLHLVVGDHDARVPPASVEADAQKLRGAGVPVTLHRFDGGHTVDAELLARLFTG